VSAGNDIIDKALWRGYRVSEGVRTPFIQMIRNKKIWL